MNIVVGNVHASDIGNLSVNDDNLAVVTAEHVGKPRELYRIHLVYLHPTLAQGKQMPFSQRAVIGTIPKGVIQGSHLYALLRFFGEQLKESTGNGVVAEIEVFQMHARLCLPDCGEHVMELLGSCIHRHDAIVMRECHSCLS